MCRNASENPAGIETLVLLPENILPGRNASENPAGIETTSFYASSNCSTRGRNASENPAGIETFLVMIESGSCRGSQRIRKPGRD